MSFYFRCFVLVCGMVIISSSAFGQSARPVPPSVSQEQFDALIKRAAYASFLGETCSIDNSISQDVRDLAKTVFPDYEGQQNLVTVLTVKKREFNEGSNVLSKAKRCTFARGETKTFISDVSASVQDFKAHLVDEQRRYQAKLQEWEAAEAIRIAAEESERQDKIRSKASALAEQLGKFVVKNVYDGGQSIGVKLVGYDFSQTEATYRLKVEIQWNGRISGESGYGADGTIIAVMDSSDTWQYGKNVTWNPSWKSSKLDEWISQKGVINFFGAVLSR